MIVSFVFRIEMSNDIFGCIFKSDITSMFIFKFEIEFQFSESNTLSNFWVTFTPNIQISINISDSVSFSNFCFSFVFTTVLHFLFQSNFLNKHSDSQSCRCLRILLSLQILVKFSYGDFIFNCMFRIQTKVIISDWNSIHRNKIHFPQ